MAPGYIPTLTKMITGLEKTGDANAYRKYRLRIIYRQ